MLRNPEKNDTNAEKTKFIGKTFKDELAIFFLEDVCLIQEIPSQIISDGTRLPDRTFVKFYNGDDVTLASHSGNNLVNELDVSRYTRDKSSIE